MNNINLNNLAGINQLKSGLTVVAISVLLTACGGGSDDSSEQNITENVDSVATFAASDIRVFGNQAATEGTKIDLSQSVKKSSLTNAYLDTTSVESLSDNLDCSNYKVSDETLIVMGDEVGSCVYQYKIRSADGLQEATGVIQVATLSEDASTDSLANESRSEEYQLAPLSAPIQVGDQDLVIDLQSSLGTDFPLGATLDVAPVLVGETGDTFTYSTTENTITLPSDRGLGYSRLFYSLSLDGDVYLGVIDITTAESTNNNLTFEDFTYNSGTSVELGETVTVNVSQYIADADTTDTLAITKVTSYNSDVVVTGNTTFTFTPNATGVFNVGVLVEDGRGGITLGTVTINAIGNYTDIVIDDGYLMSPFTYADVLDKGLYYNSLSYENDPATPLFTWTIGDAICTAFGGRLPTVTELEEAFNLHGENIATVNMWPTDTPYMSSEMYENTSSEFIVTDVSLDTGTRGAFYRGSAETAAGARALTCFFSN